MNKICEECQKEFEVVDIKEWVLSSHKCPECRSIDVEEEQGKEKEIQRVIPKRFWGIETDRQGYLKKYLEPENLFIFGAAGIGKTVLGCSLLKSYIRQDIKCLFLSFPVFIMELQGLHIQKGGNPFFKVKEIAGFDGVLMIDDLGVGKVSEFVNLVVYTILNEREQQEKKIIITSNLGLKDLGGIFGIRIVSRIKGLCEVINLKGEDRRLKKRVIRR